MANGWGLGARSMAVTAVYAATLGNAQAAGAEAVLDGNGWIAIAIILGLVVLVVLMISGIISISGRDKPDGDGAGFGVLEGIDDDEEDKKRH